MGSSNIWDAEWDVSEELAGKLIYGQFPELASKSIQKMDYGWDNTVFLVGQQYVFRFPRRRIAINLIKTEGKLLPKLADYISLPYSMPLFYGKAEEEFPAPFLGYTYLPGKYPIGLTDKQRALSAKTIAIFLKQLHAFPIQIAKENGVQLDHRNLTDLALRKKKMQKCISDITPHLDPELQYSLLNYLDELKMDSVGQQSVLLHGDLHFKNMLVDQTGKVSGVIDWGDLNIGHPAGDLNVVYSFLPSSARSEFFKVYGEVDEETKVSARLFAIYIPILIMMQAIDDKNEKIIAEAKANILRAIED